MDFSIVRIAHTHVRDQCKPAMLFFLAIIHVLVCCRMSLLTVQPMCWSR